MDKLLKEKVIIAFGNKNVDVILDYAYEIKPYNESAVETAKYIKEWFSKEKESNFDRTITRFLSLAEDKKNELYPVCYYMAAKIALFFKKDANMAAGIIRKANLRDEVFPGTQFFGYYIYQNGLVTGDPDYRLACKYLQDSVNTPMPWFESNAVLEKKSIDDKFKFHYAKKVFENINNQELKMKCCDFLFTYYANNNILIELKRLYLEVKETPELYSSSKETISNALYQLGRYYVGKKEYPLGVEAYKLSSDLINEKSSEQLGIAYYQGNLGLNKDLTEAIKYLQRLSKGNAGTYLLGLLYERGEGVEKNLDTAYSIFLKCSKSKLPEAFYKLGRIYALGECNKKKDEMQTHRYFEEYLELETNVSEARKQKIQEYYDSFKK